MTGKTFDAEQFYRDCLEKIWNQKMIGFIYDCCIHNIRVYRALGELTYGREELIADVVGFLAQFPDTHIDIEDIIWRSEQGGFKVSARWTITAHHTGAGEYGSPTGKEVSFSGLTTVFIRDARITEQWEEYDRINLLHQLELDELDVIESELECSSFSAESSAMEPHPGGSTSFTAYPASGAYSAGEVERTQGQGPPEPCSRTSGEFDPERFVRESLHRIWNRRDVGAVETYYAEDITVHSVNGSNLEGQEEVKASVLARLAPFPDAALSIDDLFWVERNKHEYNVAMRWTFNGTHRRNGIYGEPTGVQLPVTGITHQHIRNQAIVEEWNQYGEYEIIKQFHTKRYWEEQQRLREQLEDQRIDEEQGQLLSESGAGDRVGPTRQQPARQHSERDTKDYTGTDRAERE
jgi:predicted ester cyclase